MTWPVWAGTVPPLDGWYTARPETGLGAAGGVQPGETVVLTDSDQEPAVGQRGIGGTGKTQLAVGFAQSAWEARAAELVVWVTASSREAILTGYADALTAMGAADSRDDVDTAAGRFVSWLAGSTRPWLVVLDDLADPADADGLWPRGPAGRVLVTTRRRDAAPRGQDVRVVQVGGFSLREALAYLTARLTYPDQRIEALDLAEELGRRPLELAYAAALMADCGIGCRDFRLRYGERIGHVAEVVGKSSSPSVVACWSLAVERANELVPAGLAWPTLALAALLDPNGIPGQVLTSPAACAYITGRPGTGTVSDQNQIRAAVRNLARLGLVTIDPDSAARTVRLHSFLWSVVQKYLPPAEVDQAVRAAANGLLHGWPDGDLSLLGQALRDCTARLRETAGERLWNPEGHPVLFRAGQSLDRARLAGPAIAYWQMMTDASSRVLGAGHAQTALARGNLAAAYEAAGRLNDAITVLQSLFTEREAKLGPRNPATLATSASLAHAYQSAGRLKDAILLYERTLADQARVLGTGHPDTLAARVSLASAYQAAGRVKDAIPLYEQTLADRERVQGPDHRDTLTARANLAYAYRIAGRMKDAIVLYERTLADRERVQGPDHRDTLTAQANLAYAYEAAGRMKDAIPVYERTLADRERVQGPDHRDTLTACGNLASAYHSARRLTNAIPLYERTLAGFNQILGPGHPDTLTSRANLASAYHTAGRKAEAIKLLERAVADCEEAMGRRDPMTRALRENLAAVRGD
ncbi:MAG TPA: tetratricopeptide repeat protein [Streptosporangiaceae bacterium]|nr:tetratricopeptide repeat protein [Streptosporangiaceae bacterium]